MTLQERLRRQRLAVFLLMRDAISGNRELGGEEMREIRRILGFSGREYAEQLAVTPESVSRWENERLVPGPQTLRLIELLALVKLEQADLVGDEYSRAAHSIDQNTTGASHG